MVTVINVSYIIHTYYTTACNGFFKSSNILVVEDMASPSPLFFSLLFLSLFHSLTLSLFPSPQRFQGVAAPVYETHPTSLHHHDRGRTNRRYVASAAGHLHRSGLPSPRSALSERLPSLTDIGALDQRVMGGGRVGWVSWYRCHSYSEPAVL